MSGVANPTKVTQTDVLKLVVEGCECDQYGLDKVNAAETLELRICDINTKLRRLIDRGLVKFLANGRIMATPEGKAMIAAGKTVKPGPKPGQRWPLQGRSDSLRARLWRAMKRKPRFTIAELLQLASRDNDGNPRSNATKFVQELVRAGYLAKLPRRIADGKNGTLVNIYWLKTHTGPEHPRIRKDKDGKRRIYDPNTKAWVRWLDEPVDDEAADRAQNAGKDQTGKDQAGEAA